MPPNLTGYYCFVSQKNMEDYLQALNINMALRKIALLLKPDKEIDHQGNHMTVKTLSTFRNYVLEFEVGVEFEEDLRMVDGRKCQELTARDAVCKQVFRKVK
uniref:Retinol binding protein 5 n=1 Tax=Myotis myotis TaxID=51298 RepID=A0A7J7Z7V5_MYOMY|nr:retinol binding protein 5 [Myotis myotis]